MAGKEEIICLSMSACSIICSQKAMDFLVKQKHSCSNFFFFLAWGWGELYLQSCQNNGPLYVSWNMGLKGVLKEIMNTVTST